MTSHDLARVFAWLGLKSTERGVTELSDLALPHTRALAKMDEARATMLRNLNALMLRRLSADQRRDNWTKLDEATQRYHEGRTEFEAIRNLPETDAAWKQMIAAAVPWERQTQTTLEVLKEREALLARGLGGEDPQVKQTELGRAISRRASSRGTWTPSS